MSLELTDIMTNKASKLTVGGLFSGIGGLELAFQNEGFKVAWANDIDKYTHQVYKRVVGSDHYIGNNTLTLDAVYDATFQATIDMIANDLYSLSF